MTVIAILTAAAFTSFGAFNTQAHSSTPFDLAVTETVHESIPAPQDTIYPNASYVDFDRFLKLAEEVRDHRASRMVSLQEFNKMSKEKNTVILDTRSKAMYDAKHIKGAIHLNFADFTQNSLALLIPDTNTRILIYCNNNILNDEIFFPTKSLSPAEALDIQLKSLPNGPKEFPLTMALNVPTYINLYGYGYKNVYELADLVSIFYNDIQFEGTEVFTDEAGD